MKVVAFNGSPKKEGNTYHAIKMVAEELKNEGIETEIVHVGASTIKGCTGCGYCFTDSKEECVKKDDKVNEWIQKMKSADGILLGSPVHYSAIAGTMKSFLDRAFLVTTINGLLRHKVGASVVAVRRSGGLPTFDQLNNFITYSEMVMPTSSYWNVIHGLTPGEAVNDEEGNQIMRVLGKNMAWLMKSLDATKDTIIAPEVEEKIFTNFIR